MIKFRKDLQAKHCKKKATIMRCDNAGENKSFVELSKKEGLGIEFEYKSPGSPRQNRKCERKFATFYGKVCRMLNRARLTPNARHGLWTECAAYATMKEHILLSDKSAVPPYKLIFGVDAALSKNLRTFGEIRIIAIVQKKIKTKLDNHGSSCIFLLDVLPLR